MPSRTNLAASIPTSKVKYSKLASTDEGYIDLQFKKSPPKIPYKAIALATVLFLIGTLLIVIGALLLAGYISKGVSCSAPPQGSPWAFAHGPLLVGGGCVGRSGEGACCQAPRRVTSCLWASCEARCHLGCADGPGLPRRARWESRCASSRLPTGGWGGLHCPCPDDPAARILLSSREQIGPFLC
uniref:Transmembrane protein 230 n=1 Tax=Salvator merianae TaxID=96440 RepID=A0A8D0CE06_SALMN